MLQIVKLNERHIVEMAEIEKRCFKTPWSFNMLNFELNNPLAHYFVVENDGEVVAYCGIYRILDEGHITNIAVKPEYQQQGVGTKLLTEVLEMSRSSGIVQVTLEVNEHNERAIKFYEKFGFRYSGRRPKYYEGVDDAIIYWLTIAD